MKKIIFILTLCSLVILPSCTVFESQLVDSKQKQEAFLLDTALSFTKSVIQESGIEKQLFTGLEDSSIFFDDLKENESYHLHLLKDNNKMLTGSSVKEMNLDFDSIQIASEEQMQTATFYSHKKSLLYDIKKTHYITFNESKIISKTTKIEQKLLHEDHKRFEINYNYSY